jgi:glycosyltransferase involved in cell wall biosynthesis
VIIPTRSRSQLLALTLHSALGQRCVELEIIVVDDASTDDTLAMIAAVGDPRVRVISNHTAGGVSAARNRGIDEAAGRWVAFLDDDDLWAPDKLALQLDAARAAGSTWVYAGDVSIDDSLRVLSGAPPPPPEEVLAGLVRYNAVPAGASNVVVTAEALADAGPFDERLRKIEDWDMWIRLARLGPPSYDPRPLLAYRIHRGNAAVDLEPIVDEPAVLAARYGALPDRAAMHRRAAWTALRAGRRARALRHYGRAIAMGDLKSLGRAAVGVLWAGNSRSLLRLAGKGDDHRDYRSEAQAWIDPFMSTAGRQGTGQ